MGIYKKNRCGFLQLFSLYQYTHLLVLTHPKTPSLCINRRLLGAYYLQPKERLENQRFSSSTNFFDFLKKIKNCS